MTTTTDDLTRDATDGPPSMNRLATIKAAVSRTNIEQSYHNYLTSKDKVGARDALLLLVNQFAKSKVSGRLWNSAEGAETPDDFASEITIQVWQDLDGFEGEFYPWLNRICFAQGCTAFNEITKKTKMRVPLLVPEDDKDDSGSMQDNPLIRPRGRTRILPLPAHIVGTDAFVCDLIREGLNYREIAACLGVTESAIKSRMLRLKARSQADRRKRLQVNKEDVTPQRKGTGASTGALQGRTDYVQEVIQ